MPSAANNVPKVKSSAKVHDFFEKLSYLKDKSNFETKISMFSFSCFHCKSNS